MSLKYYCHEFYSTRISVREQSDAEDWAYELWSCQSSGVQNEGVVLLCTTYYAGVTLWIHSGIQTGQDSI